MSVTFKKYILPNLPSLLFLLIFSKVGQAFRIAGGTDLSANFLNLGEGFRVAFETMAPSFHPIDLLIGLCAAVIIRLLVYFK